MAYTPSQLEAQVDLVIKTMIPPNKIEPAAHNGLLKEFINTFVSLTGSGIGGLATTSTDPGTPTNPIVWFCSGPGTYTYFNNTVVSEDFAYFIWNGSSWDLYEVAIGSGYARKIVITTDIDTGYHDYTHALGTDNIVWQARQYDSGSGYYQLVRPTEKYVTSSVLRLYSGDQLNTCKITIIG